MATCSRNTTPKHRVPAPGRPWCPQRPLSMQEKHDLRETQPGPHTPSFAFLLSSSRGKNRAELSPGASRARKNSFQRFQNFLTGGIGTFTAASYSATGPETDRAGHVQPLLDTFRLERQLSSANVHPIVKQALESQGERRRAAAAAFSDWPSAELPGRKFPALVLLGEDGQQKGSASSRASWHP